jgi:hypothetical protein
MSTGPDRLALLLDHQRLTGIDFIEVDESQTILHVHFHKPPSAALEADLSREDILIAPDAPDGAPAPEIDAFIWIGLPDDRALEVIVAAPGPFGYYRLTLSHADVDPFFNRARFSFKVNCPNPFDCRVDVECAQGAADYSGIDYRARDFESYRLALLDFAAARWPDWTERHRADVGIMLLELMATLGDELAYYQDRVAWEAYLQTATQPRSARAHARLVDYETAPALAPWTWLDVQVNALAGDPAGALAAGTPVWAETLAGERVGYEIGRGLADIRAGVSYAVDSAINAPEAHLWTEDEVCLPAGATDLYVKGAVADLLELLEQLDDGTPARTILLCTDPQGPDAGARPAHRVLMRMIGAEETFDPLTEEAITRLWFDPAVPTPVDLDLESLTVHGNLLPATAGEYRSFDAVIGAAGDVPAIVPDEVRDELVAAVERAGPGDHPVHRLFLEETHVYGLCWLSPDGTAAAALPEVDVAEMRWDGTELVEEEPWTWRRSLLGSASSLPDSTDYTIEDGRWGQVREFHRPLGDVVHRDYAGADGQTLRFGDGELGLSPARGTIFRVQYRIGGGRRANVGPGAIRHIGDLPPDLAVSLSNPLAVDAGTDAETLEQVRRDAPEAWKAITYRAVRPEDYEEAAERLDWVDHAGSRSLWTGSWLSMFTTPDPRDMADLPTQRRAELEIWLDRFRQTGRDSRVSDPLYADLDLEIHICVSPDSERSDVARRVKRRLTGGEGSFFDPDARTFGDTVERARLEAAIHEVPGVRAVSSIRHRRRGWFGWRELGTRYRPDGAAEIIRVEDEPARPERGSILLLMEGGS